MDRDTPGTLGPPPPTYLRTHLPEGEEASCHGSGGFVRELKNSIQAGVKAVAFSLNVIESNLDLRFCSRQIKLYGLRDGKRGTK